MIREDALLTVLDAAAEGLIGVFELFGLDDRAEQLYEAALAFFERGATARAEAVLEWLVGAKPFVARYWTAYGATLQAREAFFDAIRAYTTALAIDEGDVIARAHRGECCLLVGLVPRGVEDLAIASRADLDPERRPWAERAARLLALHEQASALATA